MDDVIDVQATTETAIAAPMGGDLATLTPAQLEDRVAAVGRVAEAKQRMIMAAMKLTYPEDWKDFDDKPYLTGDGAERLCAVGINLSSPVFDVREEGEDVFVECLLEATWPAMGQRSTQIGTCNTKDKLWDNASPRALINQFREKAEGNERLARQMLVGHIKKKALQNAESRAVCSVMGIKGLKWEHLAAIGYTKDKAGAQVSFRKGATKASAAESKDKKQFVTMDGLAGLGIGSIVETTGTLIGVRQLTFKKDGEDKPYYKLQFADGPEMTYWGETVDFEEGSSLVIEVKVGEYQGNKQFQANHIEAAEPQG